MRVLPARPLHALLGSCLLALTLPASANSAEQVHLWAGGMSTERVAYESAAIELALEKTRSEFGDYQMTIVAEERSNERAIRELREGAVINLTSAPVWPVNLDPDPPMTIVPIPLARGLMGYRRLVVRNESLENFSSLRSLNDLREHPAGLGRGWSDVLVFEQADLPVVEGTSVSQLYSMLARKRFDYLPLGSLEVEESLQASGLADQLSIVPDLLIYYPLPIYPQVSVSRPELAKRISTGLEIAAADGSLEELFDTHYGSRVTELRAMKPRILVLANPNLPGEQARGKPELLPESDRLN